MTYMSASIRFLVSTPSESPSTKLSPPNFHAVFNTPLSAVGDNGVSHLLMGADLRDRGQLSTVIGNME